MHTKPLPPRIIPHEKPLSLMQSVRAARRNALEIIPAIAFRQPMVSGRLGARWHMAMEPEALKRIFLDNVENYPKSEVMIRMLRPAVGTSLFTTEGAEWRWQRRAVAPVFANRNVKALCPFMTETAERASARMSGSGEMEVVSEMLTATFDVICDVALSGREQFDADAFGAAITRYFQTLGRVSLLDFLGVPHWFPRPGEILGRGSVRTMHAMVSKAIEARRTAADTGRADDLLDHMMNASDPETGRRMTPKELLHNMQFFIVAGHETTALTIAWALLLLAMDQPMQDRLRDEARGVLGDRAAEAEDLDRMPLCGQVLDEALRLYPPVGMLARNVVARDELGGREILPNDTLFLPIWALQRHDLWWEAPNEFRPDRFAPGVTRDRYLHIPFGAGPRVCVGANFAMMQAGIILATLIARHRFTLKGAPPEPVMTMTLRPEPGVTLTVAPA